VLEDLKEAEMKMAEDVGDPIAVKEEDLLKRQIIMCQVAAADSPMKLVGCVNMFEAMLFEDIEKNAIPYEPDALELKTRHEFGLKPSMPLTVDCQYILALKKFRVLYRIFKRFHFSVRMDGQI